MKPIKELVAESKRRDTGTAYHMRLALQYSAAASLRNALNACGEPIAGYRHDFEQVDPYDSAGIYWPKKTGATAETVSD